MSQAFNAWSFVRDVLVRGAAIEQDSRALARGYEHHSLRMDEAARELARRLEPHLAGEPAERVESVLVVILSSWDRWTAEACQAAQREQHPDAYLDTMRDFLRPVLEATQ